LVANHDFFMLPVHLVPPLGRSPSKYRHPV